LPSTSPRARSAASPAFSFPGLTPPRRARETIGLKIAHQGGAALGAYGAGVLEAILSDPDVEIEEASGTSAGAGNIFLASRGTRQQAIQALRAYWDWIAETGEAADHAAALNPLGSYLYNSWMRAGWTPGPLDFLHHTLEKLTRGLKSSGTKLHVNTVTKKNHLGDFSPGNLQTHTHSGKNVNIDTVVASGGLASLGGWLIDGETHWDGAYSGQNPDLEPLLSRDDAPLVIISVDHPEIRTHSSDSGIIYGMIHREVDALEAAGFGPIYRINLERTGWLDDESLRMHPTPELIEALRLKGMQDGLACLKKIKQDRAFKNAIVNEVSVHEAHAAPG
jgi:predicted acylesterase/phospholipase RssA